MKITFGLYNQISDRSLQYQTHIKAITNFYNNVDRAKIINNINTEIFFVDHNDINYILEKAVEQNSDYAYIINYGHTATDPEILSKIIEHAKNNNYSIVGHIIDDYPINKGFYYLHTQCMLINIKDYIEVNKPKFNLGASVVELELPCIVRSNENAHGDYTPKYIKRTEGVRNYTGLLHNGWGLVKTFIEHNKIIGNFSSEIRNNISNLYPELRNDLEKVLNGDDTGLPVEVNQREYIEKTNISNFDKDVFVFNTCPDILELDYNKETLLDSIYCVAAGFMPLILLDKCNWNNQTTFVYFDINIHSLNFKKYLLENWDGVDYINVIEHYKNNINNEFLPTWFHNNHVLWQNEWEKIIEHFGGLSKWLDFWNRYKKLDHKFIQCDTIKDPTLLYEIMNQHNGNNLIWISNIFYTNMTVRYYHPDNVEKLYNTFIDGLYKNNNNLQICGFDTFGKFNLLLGEKQ